MLHLSPLLTAYLIFLALVLGLVMGSFCNAWAYRLAHGASIARGRSRCPRCGHVLAPRDLVPLFSWLALRGRCRYCRAPISPRYPLTELISALFFLSMLLRFGLSLELLRFLILGCLLLTAALVDLDTMELPDGLLLAAAAAALLRLPEGGWDAAGNALLGALLPALPLLLLSLLMDRILKKDSMGGGDIKLTAVLGLHFGPALTLMLLIAACVLGLLLSALLRKAPAAREDVPEGAFPFGPALALSAWLTALFGAPVLQWYLGLFL